MARLIPVSRGSSHTCWARLPDTPRACSRSRGRIRFRHTSCWASPSRNSPPCNVATAEVLVLALNPGFHPDDLLDVRNPDYAEQWRLALSFATRTPFHFLDAAFRQTGGGRWWHKRVRELIEAAGFDAVSRGLMCVEHFPYKSTRYAALGETLPSQQYSFTIVREAIRNNKPIVIMRSERIWLESVPELREYSYIRLSNHQNPYLNRAQMTNEQFERVVAAIRG